MSLFPHARSLVGAFLSLTAAVAAQPLERLDDHRLIEVVARTRAEIDQIDAIGAIILNCHFAPGKLDIVATGPQIDAIRRLGLEPRVRIENVQQALDAQVRPRPVVAGAPDPFTDFFLDYHPYDGEGGIVWYMNELVARHPERASVVNVGTTLEGRTIWGLRVTASTHPSPPAVLYFGAEHAREWVTTTVPTYLARHLLENYGIDAAITDVMDNVEFFLVPVFNVDGYVYTWTTNRLWRKNRRGGYGVDINRNWAQGWGGPGSSGSTSAGDYRGSAPFSEPETQALRDFIIAHPNLRAQLDIHSYSQLILWPLGYTPVLAEDHGYYQEVGSAMQSLIASVHGSQFAIGPIYTAIYPASGNSVDWTYTQRDMLSLSFECRDTGAYGFLLPPEQIIPNNEELVPAILHMTNSDWVRLPARFQFPQGLPETIAPGAVTTITVEIVEQTDSVAEATATVHYRFDPAAPFTADPLTHMGGSLYEAKLPPTNCTAEPEFYFTAETASDVLLRSPAAASGTDYSARMEGGRSAFMTNDLSDNPFWSTQGQWQYGQPSGAGGNEGGFSDPTSGYTGAHVYGYNLFGDYANNLGPQYLTTPPFDCTGRDNVRLEFARWLGVETPAWDRAAIEASTNGSTWTPVWQNTGEVADSAWTWQTVDLSGIADGQPAVQIRWVMGPADSAFRYCGWNIDDISLTAGTCMPLFGDFDGNGNVGSDDFGEFESCYSGESVPRGPNCAIFDVADDGDVDCDDWVEFHAAWTGPGTRPELFPGCEHRAGPSTTAAGARYLSITAPPGDEPIALHLTSSDLPCLAGYVDLVPVQNVVLGRLVAAPVYRLPAEWGTVVLADAAIVPGHSYSVRTESAGGTKSLLSDSQVFIWGDTGVDPGAANIIDIGVVVDRLKGLPTAPPIAACDFQPLVPDHLVNVSDLGFTVDAVKGFAYPFALPCP